MRLAFKGRFRSILTTIRDQSCLNMIAIESRTQGDHEELKIWFQTLKLNFFMIQSKVKLQGGRTSIDRKIDEKNPGRSIH